MKKTCFMFGHAFIPEDITESLLEAVRMHYHVYGVRVFVAGMYGDFDRMAKETLIFLQKELPEMEALLLTPYHPQVSKGRLPDGMDGTLYPEGMENAPPRLAIVRANQYMVRKADTVICYVNRVGNTKKLLEAAEKRRNLVITNLAAPT